MNFIEELIDTQPNSNLDSETISSQNLQWAQASNAQLIFMKRVYDINLVRLRSSTFIADVPSNELALIENNFYARTDAARACQNLLSSARSHIQNQNLTIVVGITSAYRSASHQYNLWQRYFPNYYNETVNDRVNFNGDPHSEEAAQFLAGYIRKRIATPGFSNHNNGLAVDFLNIENNVTLANRTLGTYTSAWRNSWFWNWLLQNANGFGYYQNTAIDEPWHWEYRGLSLTNATSTEYLFSENSFAETPGTSQKITSPRNVHYLAFEGGGGKGLIFSGAIRALEQLNILTYADGKINRNGQLKGICGSSAGAITALLLSLGYNSAEIDAELTRNNFNTFFDLPTSPPQVPQPNAIYRTLSVNEQSFSVVNYFKRIVESVLNRLTTNSIIGSFIRNTFLTPDNLNDLTNAVYQSINNVNADERNYELTRKLVEHPLMHFEYLINAWGLFSGVQIQNFFSGLIQRKTGRRDITFAEHHQLFGIKLIVTGSNLQTKKAEYFSVDTTPNLSIVTATRISMSVPFVFAPVKITRTQAAAIQPATGLKLLPPQRLEGCWVDGGLYNNIPISAFESENHSGNPPIQKPYTLGLRLDRDSASGNPINSLPEYLIRAVNPLNFGEAQLSGSSGFMQQTIDLNSGSIGMLNFSPDRQTLLQLQNQAFESVRNYFNTNTTNIPNQQSRGESFLDNFFTENISADGDNFGEDASDTDSGNYVKQTLSPKLYEIVRSTSLSSSAKASGMIKIFDAIPDQFKNIYTFGWLFVQVNHILFKDASTNQILSEADSGNVIAEVVLRHIVTTHKNVDYYKFKALLDNYTNNTYSSVTLPILKIIGRKLKALKAGGSKPAWAIVTPLSKSFYVANNEWSPENAAAQKIEQLLNITIPFVGVSIDNGDSVALRRKLAALFPSSESGSTKIFLVPATGVIWSAINDYRDLYAHVNIFNQKLYDDFIYLKTKNTIDELAKDFDEIIAKKKLEIVINKKAKEIINELAFWYDGYFYCEYKNGSFETEYTPGDKFTQNPLPPTDQLSALERILDTISKKDYSTKVYFYNNALTLSMPDEDPYIEVPDITEVSCLDYLDSGEEQKFVECFKNERKFYAEKIRAITKGAGDLLTAIADIVNPADPSNLGIAAFGKILKIADLARPGYKLLKTGKVIDAIIDARWTWKEVSVIKSAINGASNIRRSAVGVRWFSQVHHIIPVNVLKRSRAVQAAVLGGFKFNDAVVNGIPLLRRLHVPVIHWSGYDRWVFDRITEFEMSNKNYSNAAARQFLEDVLVPSLRKSIDTVIDTVK